MGPIWKPVRGVTLETVLFCSCLYFLFCSRLSIYRKLSPLPFPHHGLIETMSCSFGLFGHTYKEITNLSDTVSISLEGLADAVLHKQSECFIGPHDI